MQVIAHRGASASAPENTLAAFEEAIALRAQWVETDVQRSADGQLVLVHDASLRRTTDVAEAFPGRERDPVGSFTAAELRELDAGGWFGALFGDEPLPTLRALFALVEDRIGVMLELKDPALYPGIERQLAEEIAGAPGFSLDRLVVQSFDHASMRRLHEHAPDVPIGLLLDEKAPDREWLRAAAGWARQVNPGLHLADTGDVDGVPFVDAVHEHGLTTSVYTVNDNADMLRMAERGVDGLITDRPGAARRVLG